jgi:hypothetical protein
MTVQFVALVVKPKVRNDGAAVAMQLAFWRAFSSYHVHDYAKMPALGLFACIRCGTTIRRIP